MVTSPDRPWKAHHVMTTERARGVLARRFPGLDVDTLEHLGSGWEFDAFLTGDGWVFRLPRRAEGAAQLAREGPILDLVRRALGPDVQVPQPALFAEPGTEFPYPVVGHRLIEGVHADHPDVRAGGGLAAAIGAALGRLHAVPAEDARAAGIGEDREGVRALDEETRHLVRELRGTAPAVDAALDWLAGDPPVPEDHPGPFPLIHNDLCPEHVLVRPETGTLVGLIDWTDAALADPALDFVFLVTWRGWPFTEAVLQSYPLPLDPAFRARLEHLARVLSLAWLHEARERGEDLAKHVGWVERAFGR